MVGVYSGVLFLSANASNKMNWLLMFFGRECGLGLVRGRRGSFLLELVKRQTNDCLLSPHSCTRALLASARMCRRLLVCTSPCLCPSQLHWLDFLVKQRLNLPRREDMRLAIPDEILFNADCVSIGVCVCVCLLVCMCQCVCIPRNKNRAPAWVHSLLGVRTCVQFDGGLGVLILGHLAGRTKETLLFFGPNLVKTRQRSSI